MAADFFLEIIQGFRGGDSEASSLLKGKKIHLLSILYSTKISFKNEGKIKTFSDTKELKQLITKIATQQKF